MKKPLALGVYFGLFTCAVLGSVPQLQQAFQQSATANIINAFVTNTDNETIAVIPFLDDVLIKPYYAQPEWIPWSRLNYAIGVPDECIPQNHSFYDFPDDLFTQEQRLQGAIVLHFLAVIYFFTITAVIINDYFLPSVECICEDLKLSKDVAAATFMATATTMPEFFSNTISTFIAQSDMGVGNILGSIMFNILIVAAVIGFFDTAGGKMEWWQSTRDCFLLAINITLLAIFAWDTHIQWWEALILLFFLIVYYAVMFQNERVSRLFSKFIDEKWNCCKRYNQRVANDKRKKIRQDVLTKKKQDANKTDMASAVVVVDEAVVVVPIKIRKSLWHIPMGVSKLKKFWWFYTWPIKLVLTICIPSPKTYRFLYPLSFIMCIVCIGLNSYMSVWMLTTIGYTFSIPESIMGLTILAWGGCLPELFSALFTALKGGGGANISNSLGTNSLSILFSLGFPWFLRGVINLGQGKDPFVTIGSYGIEYIILSLLVIIVLFYVIVYITNYRLIPKTSIILILIYIIFLAFAIIIELDILFKAHC